MHFRMVSCLLTFLFFSSPELKSWFARDTSYSTELQAPKRKEFLLGLCFLDSEPAEFLHLFVRDWTELRCDHSHKWSVGQQTVDIHRCFNWRLLIKLLKAFNWVYTVLKRASYHWSALFFLHYWHFEAITSQTSNQSSSFDCWLLNGLHASKVMEAVVHYDKSPWLGSLFFCRLFFLFVRPFNFQGDSWMNFQCDSVFGH